MLGKEKFYQPEFIENYVKGLCEASDKAIMQELLQKDTDLLREVNFHKDLLTAIADSRKKDLKILLQNTPIPVNKPFYQEPFVQIVATLVGVLSVTIAVWVLNQPTKEVQSHSQTPKKVETYTEVLPKKVEEKATTQVPENILPQPESKKEVIKKELPKNEQKDKNPPFIREIHYQYDGGKVLQLFGDFKYELLEKIDVGAGEKTYIYIQNRFYELIPTQLDEVRNLKENLITDKEQIKLLTESLVKK